VWTWRSLGAGIHIDVAVTFGNGHFVTLGDSPRRVGYSTNALNWTVRILGNFQLKGATYGLGTFVAVGDRGVIVQSDPLPSAKLVAGPLGEQGLPLTITGEAGLGYRLQATTELPAANWTDLLTFTNTVTATNFVDTGAADFN